MTGRRLFNVERSERILAELHQHGSVRVRDLARDLGVSELTIRRDISALARRNLVTKAHGGATLPPPTRSDRRPLPTPPTLTIGMVVPSLDFWTPIVSGARAVAAGLGVRIQLRNPDHDPDEYRRQISHLVDADQVHGLLFAPSLPDPDATRLIEWIGELDVPTVLVKRALSQWIGTRRPVEWVCTDYAAGLAMAVHHLRQQGHQRIGLVRGHGPTSTHLERAWRFAGPDHGLSDVMTAPSHDMLAECRHSRTTALIVHGDASAIVSGCADLGLSIPDDLAVVSYDDETAPMADPTITVIRPPKHHIGRIAVELMAARLLDGQQSTPARRVLVAPELVVRQSSLGRPGGPDAQP